MAGELFHTVALTQVKGVGPEGARTLIAACGSATDVFNAPQKELTALPGLGPKMAERIKSFEGFDRVNKELEFIRNHKIQALTFADKGYPARLKEVSNAPAVVFFKGTEVLNHPRVIGIVGTRRVSDYGKGLVQELVQDLAPYNVLTVSGMAYGVDILCHRKSLEFNIPTVSVMAHGLDMVYPSAHTATARDMTRNGGIMTEHISETLMRKEYFPRRNRLVAGLVDALVVVESPEKGGSLITAEIAHSYSRDVFAFPGRTHDDKSAGCNNLIKKQKAQLIESAADLAWFLGWPSSNTQSNQNSKLAQLRGVEKRIYMYLREKPEQKCHLDIMCEELNIHQGELSLILLNMEFNGLVRCMPGNSFKAE